MTAGGLTISKANEFDVATTNNGQLRAEFSVDGTVTNVIYTPNTDFNSDNLPLMDGSPRLDDFTYTIEDNGGEQASATVSLSVVPTIRPRALDDSVALDEDGDPITIDVLSRDGGCPFDQVGANAE